MSKPTPKAIEAARAGGVNASDSFCPDCGAIYEWDADPHGDGIGKCNSCGSGNAPVDGELALDSADFSHVASFSGSTITVPARLSRAGDYPDKGISLTVADFDAAAAQVSPNAPVAMNMAHVARGTILDGLLGQIERVYRKGEELWGDVAVPSWLASVAREAGITRLPLSAEWDRATKRLTGCAWEKHPRIPDAALVAAFTSSTAGKPAPKLTAGALALLLTTPAARRHEGNQPMKVWQRFLAILPFVNLDKPEAVAAVAEFASDLEDAPKPTDDIKDGETAEFTAIRERAEKAERELVTTNAKARVASLIAAKKALPSEEAGLVSMFTQAALDDAKSPTTVSFTVGAESKTGTRVDSLKAIYEGRKPHSLTEEQMPSGAAVFTDAEDKPKPASKGLNPREVHANKRKSEIGAK